jgi:hypothetical protein
MNVIQPNCRVQFTAEDILFVLSVVGNKAGDADCLSRLLADEDTRDLILDDESIYRSLLERKGCLKVSTHFYFYVLVRQVLKRSGIEDRSVADYVAEVLAEFSRLERSRCVLPGKPRPVDYFFEMLAALETVDDYSRFCIRAHIGNHSLFFAGVFPERIRYRTERRGAPALQYFESVGSSSYRAASDHRLARQYELASIFNTLADRFQTARRALNDLADRVLSLGDTNRSVEMLLQQFHPERPA